MTMKATLQGWQQRLHKYKKWEPAVFFVAGFTFDAFLLHRIDDPLMLIHQAIYLTLSATIIAWDLFVEDGKAQPPRWLGKLWGYREGLLHFLLGTLLNVYTIFYFKSGTFLSSLLFLVLLAALLFLNEVRPKPISKHMLRNALFALCLMSYMNIVVSIVVGFIGAWVFLGSVAVAGLILASFVYLLRRRLDSAHVSRNIRMPFLLIALVYSSLYLFKILPPVPLSMKFIGIYHDIEKSPGGYKLGYQRPAWRFWESGDQIFNARAGDKIYCFVQVFSPTQFKDQLFVRWQYEDPRAGWTNSDAIALNVVGGRAEGYRGYTVKSNYQPGNWRVSIETNDGRQVGLIGVRVNLAENSTPPELTFDTR